MIWTVNDTAANPQPGDSADFIMPYHPSPVDADSSLLDHNNSPESAKSLDSP
jgi:hypothetical protein